MLAADPILSEFQASNDNTIEDANGNSSDWIEIYNAGDLSVNLLGYSLSDNASNPTKFILPTINLAAGEHLLVFASGDNAPDSAGNIHTNFRLSADGEYVGLFDPSGNVLSEFGVGGTNYAQQLEDVSFGRSVVNGEYVVNSERYFVQPSPSSLNTPNAADLFPIVTNVTRPTAAIDGQNLVIEAAPISLSHSITQVNLTVHVGFGGGTAIAMVDNGMGVDVVAGDGVYTAEIPSTLFEEGDMVRWIASATSSNGDTGKAPTFLHATKSPQFFGTVVADSAIDTPLPVIQWFTNNVAGATGGGARGSVYYNGEFYDNVLVRRRGQSSNNSPKKNLKFDFNPGDRFRLEPGMARVDEINITNTYYDQADVRATLSSEVFESIGQPSPISFPIHTRLNGQFYSLAIYIEQVDAEFLQRNGLDPNGALYKADAGSAGNNGFNPIHGLTGFLKRTRLDEGDADLQELANAVNENLPQSLRAEYLYDNVDIFSVINYLAGTSMIHNADHLGKNHYVYQDTDGTGKWSFLPWDLDLTFGKNGANTPNTEVYQAAVTNQSDSAYPNSHPFFGGSEYTRFSNSDLYNRLIDAVYDTPEFREMYLRRLRTVMDTILQSPDTPSSELILDARLVELLNLIQDDWDADDARWIEAPQTDRDRGTDWGEDLPLATHIQRIIDRYLEPRRNHLYNTHNIDKAGVANRLVQTSDALSYLVPASSVSDWQTLGFNDNAWGVGDQGIGYDFNTGYDSLLGTDLDPPTGNRPKNVYTRTRFQIANQQELDAIASLFLDVRYDDGFIAYINGDEVARSSGTNGSGITATTPSHEAAGQESFPLNASAIGALSVGDNVLAIHGINSSTTSSDLLLRFALTGTDGGDPEVAGIPDAQLGNPTITFDDVDFDANPISGIQAQEYLRLNNSGESAVDVSGWKLTGGVELTFRQGTVIPAGGQLYAVADVQEFQSRTTGPSGGQSLLTHGNYQGQLSFAGETVQLLAGNGQVMDSMVIAPSTGSDLQQYLRVTEIHYHPNSVSGAEEFIEFTNISSGGNSVDLNISGAMITDGPSATFTFSAGTSLSAGERMVVVRDVAAFQSRYPSVPGSKIVGQYAGRLSDSGERIRVADAGNNTVFEVTYGDSQEWSFAADGAGATLVLKNPSDVSFQEFGKHYAWRMSSTDGGSPAATDAPANVKINEVLSHTDLPKSDTIELYNNNPHAISIGGWWLSDSPDDLQKFQIPANTVLAAGEFAVFDESDFNPNPTNPTPKHFALSAAGDEIYLVKPSDSGGSIDFVDAVEFGAMLNGESFGRIPDGEGRLAPLVANSFAASNGNPRIADLLISEVHYHPSSPSAAALSVFQAFAPAGEVFTSNDLEFIEIHNPTQESVSLTGWRLRGESDLDFTAGATLGAGESIVSVAFDPDVDTARAQAFRVQYGIGAEVTLSGPFSASLNNSFGRVELELPEDGATFVTADEVLYDDLAPWPIDADGLGVSLQRVGPTMYGNAAASWLGMMPTPGSVDFTPMLTGDYNRNGLVDQADYEVWLANYNSRVAVNADGNKNGIVDAADYTIWRDSLDASNLQVIASSRIPRAAPIAAAAITSDVTEELGAVTQTVSPEFYFDFEVVTERAEDDDNHSLLDRVFADFA